MYILLSGTIYDSTLDLYSGCGKRLEVQTLGVSFSELLMYPPMYIFLLLSLVPLSPSSLRIYGLSPGSSGVREFKDLFSPHLGSGDRRLR